ncbi:ATP-dependent nuclease [Methylovulum psychrotolerans]|uniref:Spermidine/putrescine ABC transporter ATP-binding protein n=1 Tax=Methylovulum psychrotolerans TaxID=1704499 RepID=A0A1Z4BVM2_9GAMM|nr:AAA family ATPase [Methylovulum psychrotolerans]ASF45259.1 spermidine/putrescine ABC transporter ATP-binding protein [Methylovulum psychrotolerans]
MDSEFICILFDVQHIKELFFRIELSNKLMCIVGKNSVGKTTLIRAIKNITSANTFAKTASPYIFKDTSCIRYIIDGTIYNFQYNPKLRVIDTKSIINEKIKRNIYAELPIPHGERFNHFQRLSEIDEELRKGISLKEYSTPDDLIEFLSRIYRSDRFENLKEIKIKGKRYYFILKENGFYIREDYLSSGEHFIINLYKIIKRKCKLIVIDEIDISLDASAQVNLIAELRRYCEQDGVNIVFTTHSLALMKTLKDSELFYMESNNSEVSLKEVPYNYIRSELFCFQGRWDKYILVEDVVLEQYLSHLINQKEMPLFFTYKIIYIGGASNVIDLMKRNEKACFFSSPENVISILDGDKKEECKNNQNVFFIPFESVEKQLSKHYRKTNRDGLPEVTETYKGKKEKDRIKKLYEDFTYQGYQHSAVMTNTQIFDFINERKKNEVEQFKKELIGFLQK